jgi:cellobiose phosphorylase
VPRAWRGFEIVFKYHSARYEIAVENPRGVNRGVTRVELDGVVLPEGCPPIPLSDDGDIHRVRATLG